MGRLETDDAIPLTGDSPEVVVSKKITVRTFGLRINGLYEKTKTKKLESSHPETETFKFYRFISIVDTHMSYFLGTLGCNFGLHIQ